jgi:hypothetical protein
MTQEDQERKTNQDNYNVPPYPYCKEDFRAWRRSMRHHDAWHGIFWGGLLIVLGLCFLAANIFNFSLHLWWPVILVVIGAGIMSRFFFNRNNETKK